MVADAASTSFAKWNIFAWKAWLSRETSVLNGIEFITFVVYAVILFFYKIFFHTGFYTVLTNS